LWEGIFPTKKEKEPKRKKRGGLMETDVDVEILKDKDFHIDLQNACWRFAQFPQARRLTTHRGGPNQMIKVGQIKWTKPEVEMQVRGGTLRRLGPEQVNHLKTFIP
jgi:hypothetical protein